MKFFLRSVSGADYNIGRFVEYKYADGKKGCIVEIDTLQELVDATSGGYQEIIVRYCIPLKLPELYIYDDDIE